ncbi:MAG TPA: DUF2127 domain-containing protein [Candidatus Acidoferrales bacterium]
MHKASSASVLHESFLVSIVLKGLGALSEVIAGLAFLKISPDALNRIVLAFIATELPEDRHDFIARHLRDYLIRFGAGGKHFATWYLLSHGAVKLILVIALWMNELWAYPAMIVVLAGFISYQIYRFVLTHSMPMIFLSVFDLLVIALTWSEYRRQRASRPRA